MISAVNPISYNNSVNFQARKAKSSDLQKLMDQFGLKDVNNKAVNLNEVIDKSQKALDMLDRIRTSIANMPQKEIESLMNELDIIISKFKCPETKF